MNLRLARRAARRVLGPRQIEEADLVYALFGRHSQRILLEVGAHRGDIVFEKFAASGWLIHAFEPDPDNRRYLERTIRGMRNVTVVPKAVSDKPGTMTLYRSPLSTGISSLFAFTKDHEPAVQVEVVTLADYLRENSVAKVDFLKIDVEGYERFVMAGYPWSTHRPGAVLLEFEDRKTLQLGYSWGDLADELRALGYSILVSEWFPAGNYTSPPRFRRYVPYPTTLVDTDAWGNLIAVQPSQFERLSRLARIQVARVRLRQLSRM